MVDINALTFDLTGCTLVDEGTEHRVWVNADGVGHKVEFHATPPSWTCDPTDGAACVAFFRDECASVGGAMVSLAVTTAAGCEAVRGIFKYRRSSPSALGLRYVAILWIPFAECYFQVLIEAVERGTTGTRESTVMTIRSTQPQAGWPASPDDEIYDSTFPEHPLTRVRLRLVEVMRTLALDAGTTRLQPFRRLPDEPR